VPNTEGLGLERAGVETERGRILTDEGMRTSVPHIGAAGDCTSPHEIVHLAVMQGEIAAHNLAQAGSMRAMDYRLLTGVVFTDPQVAVVGLTEKEARRRGENIQVARYAYEDHGKCMILQATDGYVKLLADARSGEILGGACVGQMGGELIHEIAVAMHARLSVGELAAVPHYHPTVAEIWTYPAEELAGLISGVGSGGGGGG
jgi:pyruvate/2-oxoglutarate dehydrogenase complex dihydrolipoamide dehydrogenase (E3) component